MEAKAVLRKKYAALRKSLTEQERAEKNQKIREALLGSELFLQTDCLYTYLSYGTESDTRELVSVALQLEKRVFVPKVYPERKNGIF